RPGPLALTTASAKFGLRALARRWLALDEEIKAPWRGVRGRLRLPRQRRKDIAPATNPGAGS
ncbi:hypothetical protein ACFQX4_25795, partial [Roseomonas sp. GCM10028921]